MLKTIPAIKVGMTSSFDEAGTTVPVTIVRPYTCVVTEIKRPERHGYAAVQVAYRETLPKRVTKPLKGILQKSGIAGSVLASSSKCMSRRKTWSSTNWGRLSTRASSWATGTRSR